jgi:hypothetical protein
MCLSLALGAATLPANADNTVVVVQPNPHAQQFVDNLKRNQEAAAQTGQGLGQILGNAQAKQIAKFSVIIKCNHYHLIEVTYRNGSIKVIDDPRAPGGRNEPVDRDNLMALATTLPGFTWGELPCEEQL